MQLHCLLSLSLIGREEEEQVHLQFRSLKWERSMGKREEERIERLVVNRPGDTGGYAAHQAWPCLLSVLRSHSHSH